ncbi:MAG: hypothetical protein MI744_19525 [Pseudomonadales bacterium]|nr:hypothetical protein [Pseudomonadales bacterium]
MFSGVENLHIIISISLGLFPAIFVLFWVKGENPWAWESLIAGILLVMIATFHLGIMTNLSDAFPLFAENGHVSEEQVLVALDEIKLWALMFPAVVGAIGANFITGWFQSSRPND